MESLAVTHSSVTHAIMRLWAAFGRSLFNAKAHITKTAGSNITGLSLMHQQPESTLAGRSARTGGILQLAVAGSCSGHQDGTCHPASQWWREATAEATALRSTGVSGVRTGHSARPSHPRVGVQGDSPAAGQVGVTGRTTTTLCLILLLHF